MLHTYGWRQFEFGNFISRDAQAQCSFENQAYSRLIATLVNTWGSRSLSTAATPKSTPEWGGCEEFEQSETEAFAPVLLSF